MTAEQLSRIRTWVEAYVMRFRGKAKDLPVGLVLKLDHTRHVAANARDIARDLQWSPEDVRLAEALGWLHDVGRFAQFAEFGHFQDATSVDHGLRGFEIVRESGVLAQLPEACCGCLLEGIRHHNAKTIPLAATPASLPFLKLIRDADKLDIFRVVIEGLERDGFRELAGMWPHIDLDGPVNPHLQHDIQTRRRGDVANVQSRADFVLLLASWICDLNYAPTREEVRRRRILDGLRPHLPDDPATQAILGEIQAHLDNGTRPMNAPPTPCEAHAG